MDKELISIEENRDLWRMTRDITSGRFLTKEEYKQIVNIIKGAVVRIMSEPAV